MKGILNWLRTEESGQGMVEYGLIIAGIAVVVMGAIFLLGPKIEECSPMFRRSLSLPRRQRPDRTENEASQTPAPGTRGLACLIIRRGFR